MQVLVNGDNHIRGSEGLLRRVEAEVGASLARYSKQITRVEVRLNDVNGEKGGTDDKRCLMEARPAGYDPIVVTHRAGTVREAIDGATEKLERALKTMRDRLSHRKGNVSSSGDPDPEAL